MALSHKMVIDTTKERKKKREIPKAITNKLTKHLLVDIKNKGEDGKNLKIDDKHKLNMLNMLSDSDSKLAHKIANAYKQGEKLRANKLFLKFKEKEDCKYQKYINELNDIRAKIDKDESLIKCPKKLIADYSIKSLRNVINRYTNELNSASEISRIIDLWVNKKFSGEFGIKEKQRFKDFYKWEDKGYIYFSNNSECRINRYVYRLKKEHDRELKNRFSINSNFKIEDLKYLLEKMEGDKFNDLIIGDFIKYFGGSLYHIENLLNEKKAYKLIEIRNREGKQHSGIPKIEHLIFGEGEDKIIDYRTRYIGNSKGKKGKTYNKIIDLSTDKILGGHS